MAVQAAATRLHRQQVVTVASDPQLRMDQLASSIYRGSTTHTRRTPSSNKFTYSIYMGYVDLHELQSGRLDCWPIFSSKTPRSLLSLLARDHMVHESQSKDLWTRVADLVQRETGTRPDGPIRLLTNLRVMGVEFNPVSFYYVFDRDGQRLVNVVAEVSNIPWLEQHSYVLSPLQCSQNTSDDAPDALAPFSGHPKSFHVSPFMPIDHLSYKWLVSTPAERLRVRIALLEHSVDFFMASIDVRRWDWNKPNLLWMQCVHPLHTLRVIGAIMYEAVKLFRRGFQFFPHPDGTETAASRAVETVVRYGTACADLMNRLFKPNRAALHRRGSS